MSSVTNLATVAHKLSCDAARRRGPHLVRKRYLDFPVVRRLVANGERARTWDAHLHGRPGLLASCYNAAGEYRDVFGVPRIAKSDPPPQPTVIERD